MYFEGASNALGNDIGAVIISPEGCHTPLTARLCFNCTNNMAEYEACIMGLRATIDLRIKFLSVFRDSALAKLTFFAKLPKVKCAQICIFC